MTYQYQPYPKWIDTAEGRKIVHSEEEHMRHVPPAADGKTEEEDHATRDDLIGMAESLGIKIDGRWSDARLAKEIENAK